MAPHTPHDDVYDIAVSPNFAQDGMVFVVCRDMFLKSKDHGRTWTNLVNGLNNMYQYFTDTAQRFSLDISSQDTDFLYFASRGDGVYRSTDEGSSWSRVDLGSRNRDITLVAVSPESPRVVFAAAARQGLLATDDGGETWNEVRGVDAAVTAISFSPGEASVLLVGDENGTLHLSTGRGRTWRSTPLGGVGRVRSIACSPNFPADQTIFVGTELGGVFESSDGGASFVARNAGLSDLSISSVVFSPTFASDSTLWVSTWTGGVFASQDGGATWNQFSVGLTRHPQKLEARYDERPHFGCLRIAAGGEADHPALFLAAFDGLFHSTDGARSWREPETLPATLKISVAVSPNFSNDSSVAVTTYINGAFLSEDGGDTWRPINKGLQEGRYMRQAPDCIARLFAIGFAPTYAADDTLFCAGWTYFLRSPDRGRSWQRIEIGESLPLQQLVMEISPGYEHDRTIFLGNRFGDIFRSTDGGDDFSVVANIGGHVRALAASPEFLSDATLFATAATAQHQVHASFDRGATWTHAGSGLANVKQLAVSPNYGVDRTLFGGTSRGLFVTTNGGQTWQRAEFGASASENNIESLAVSPDFANDGTVLVTASGRGLFKSTDGAATFTAIGTELLERNQIFANIPNPVARPIVFSPAYAIDQTVFGYSPTDVFRSTDGGETWTAISPPRTLHEMPPPRAAPGGAPRSEPVQERLGPLTKKEAALEQPRLWRRQLADAVRSVSSRVRRS